MQNLEKIRWVILIEEGQLSGIYRNERCQSDTHLLLDDSDKALTVREFEDIATYVVDTFIEIEYLTFSDMFR